MPEDSHFALLSNLDCFRTLLEAPFIPPSEEAPGINRAVLVGMAVDPLNTLGIFKHQVEEKALGSAADPNTGRKQRVSAPEKEVIKEMQSSCNFIYDFPEVEIIASGNDYSSTTVSLPFGDKIWDNSCLN